MNKLYITFLLSITSLVFVQAQNELYNNGSLIYINNQVGTLKAYSVTDMPTLYVDGEINNNSGTLENALGEIQITGDFTNSGTYTSTGDDVFVGSATNSVVNGAINGTLTTNNFRNLFVVKNTASLDLNTNVNVANHLNIQSGRIRTDIASHGPDGSAYPNELYILNTNPTELISGLSGNTRYVEGRLRLESTSGNTYFFPIGANSHDGMEPVSITVNSGSNSILGYIKPADPIHDYTDLIFRDIGTDPGPSGGFSAYLTCVPGAGPDGYMDGFPLNNDFDQEWYMTSSGLNYDITVQPGPILDATSSYSTICDAGVYKYMLKNGIPGGGGYTPIPGLWVPTGPGTFLHDYNGITLAPTGNTLTGQTTFSGFKLAGPGTVGGALPVTLVSLQANPINNEFIRVSWVTASEINNKGFDVLRSTDGVSFEKIGWVDAQGDGNSTTTLNYAFDDKNVVANKMYYYRLNQVDKDNARHITYIVNATLNGTNTDQITIGDFFPNPSSNSSAVLINTYKEMDIHVQLYNNLSQVVTDEKIHLLPGVNTVSLPLNTITEGIYHGIFVTPNGNISRQIVVTK